MLLDYMKHRLYFAAEDNAFYAIMELIARHSCVILLQEEMG
jgi:hypothetical protein